MNIDFQTLTIGEIAKIEEIAGLAITDLMAMTKEGSGIPMGKPLAAFAYVLKKRQDCTFTEEQAYNLTFGELSDLFGSDEDEDEAGKELN